jgi:hypothetical protein
LQWQARKLARKSSTMSLRCKVVNRNNRRNGKSY